LASVYAPRGTLIAFSTSPGQIAYDGVGQKNGLYTGALLQHIGSPDCAVEAMFKKVRNTLSVASSGKQISWEHTSLATEFFFNLSVGARINIYHATAFRDALLELDESRGSHRVIKGLKTAVYDKQNAALARFDDSAITRYSEDILFVIGRNIYQAACGGAHAATNFINKFSEKTGGAADTKKKALLDGMLFEVFFDSDGKLRDDFKDRSFNQLFSLQRYASTSPSFEFISECLLPHTNRFYALPGKVTEVSVDVVLTQQKGQEAPNVQRICIASDNLLRPEDDEESEEGDEPSRFRTLSRQDFEIRISTQLMIPLRLLSFTYSGATKRPSHVRSPTDWTVRKKAD